MSELIMVSESRRPWIIIITHGLFGDELRKSCELILGAVKDVFSFSLIAGMSPEELLENVESVVNEAPKGSVIFTDIPSGTPSNVAMVFAKRHGTTVICGVNLPLLIEAEMLRNEMTAEELADHLVSTGHESIVNITKKTNERELI
jgi:D-glucosaminate PTS system EIIA component